MASTVSFDYRRYRRLIFFEGVMYTKVEGNKNNGVLLYFERPVNRKGLSRGEIQVIRPQNKMQFFEVDLFFFFFFLKLVS